MDPNEAAPLLPIMGPKEEKETWAYKAVLALRGNQTIAGCILLSVLGKTPKHPPRIYTTASIDYDGRVWVGMQRLNYEKGMVCLGLVGDVRDEFRRLADHLKLNDGERQDMFDELRKWHAIDLRAMTKDPTKG